MGRSVSRSVRGLAACLFVCLVGLACVCLLARVFAKLCVCVCVRACACNFVRAHVCARTLTGMFQCGCTRARFRFSFC